MRRFGRFLTSSLLLATSLTLAAGCGDDLPEAGQAPIATGQLDERMSFVEVGELLEIEVELREEDGAKSSFRWIWDEAESDLYDLETTVDRGRLRVSFRPLVPGRFFLSGRAEVERAGGKTDIFALSVADVRAWGGAPSHPVAAHAQMDLLIDEKRRTFAFPMTTEAGAAPFRSIGAGPVDYAIQDPGVATVDGTGLVQGVGEGSTTLTMSYGGQSESIPVRVSAGTPQPPAPGNDDLSDEMALDLSAAWQEASPNDHMVVDEQGYPAFVAVVNPHPNGEGAAQVVLARWTGSGWGLELASRPFDAAIDARVAIDGQGDLQFLYSSDFVRSKLLNRDEAPGERSFVAASERDTGIEHFDLANTLDGADDAEVVQGFGAAFALAGRPEGGAYASYLSHGVRRQTAADGREQSLCMDHLHLVSFSSAGS